MNIKGIWHYFRYHWFEHNFGRIWYTYYVLDKPELGTIHLRAARFYRKLDMVLEPIGTMKGMELHLNNATDEEWQSLIDSQNPAELSRKYLDIVKTRSKNVSSDSETAKES